MLLGLLVSTEQGLKMMSKESFTAIIKLLFDEELQVREAVSWVICRISFSRAGCSILYE